MKTGMSTACFFCKMYNEKSVKKIASMGIRDIEVFFSAMSEYEKPFTDELVRSAKGEGARIRSVHALCTQFEPQLYSTHMRQYEEALDVFDRVTDAAARMGAETYVFHGAMNVKRAKTFHVNYEWCGERTTILAERAKKKGVKLAYETVHWCWYNAPGFARELLKHVESDNLYFTLDIKQAAQSGYEIADYIDDMGARLAHIHVCDYIKDAEKGIIPCLPFDGEMDWTGMKKKLKRMDYRGLLMLEVYPNDYASYDDLLENYTKVAKFFE
ncbi:MAG: sugar phosphate isomerase/epimerase [Christensenella sp.]